MQLNVPFLNQNRARSTDPKPSQIWQPLLGQSWLTSGEPLPAHSGTEPTLSRNRPDSAGYLGGHRACFRLLLIFIFRHPSIMVTKKIAALVETTRDFTFAFTFETLSQSAAMPSAQLLEIRVQ
ncbi:hypothetical protein M9458_055696, partial [Cirrhinus mrigala]